MPDTDSHSPLHTLQQRLGYTFCDQELLQMALTHPSCAQEDTQIATNQRLEFLGDAILGFILADTLYHSRPDDREGALTKARSALARGKHLSVLARQLGIAEALRMSQAELDQGGNLRTAALEDALEAVIGAIYLDGGLEAARQSTLHCFGDIEQVLAQTQSRTNAKGQLQEHLQAQGLPTPEYRLTATDGPPHERCYTIEVWFQGQWHGTGTGSSIKAAEEAAAAKALESGALPAAG